MAELVEAVARALCEGDPDRDWRDQGNGLMLSVAIPPEDRPLWTQYRKKAHAALAAIEAEGPTSEMVTAGIEAWGEWLESEEWRREVLVAEMFRRMMACKGEGNE